MESESESANAFHPWNVAGLTSSQITDGLKRQVEHQKIRLSGLDSHLAGIGSGTERSLELLIDGDVGPFAWMLSQNQSIEVTGSAGTACGHSLISGSILIRGNCDDFLGAYAVGGLIAVHGKGGNYVGYGLSGADVVVRSRCGEGVGAQMHSGLLVVGNGAGQHLGAGMTGGTIYVRGSVGGVADGVRPTKMSESDSLRLGLLLARAGLKAKASEFQVFRAEPLR